MQIVALTIAFLLLLSSCRNHLAAEANASFTSCYIYRDDVSDVSFTYGYNAARLAAHGSLLQDVQLDLRSNAYSDFVQVANATERLESILRSDGCNLVMTTSSGVMGNANLTDFAVRYPSVFFMERLAVQPPARPWAPSNYASYQTLMYQNIFAAGAIAAAQSSSCIGVIYPYRTQRWIPNAVQQGAIWADITTPVFAVMLGSSSNPQDEIGITDLLLKRGCDIILSVSTSSTVAQYVASLQRDTIMGIGFGQDASLTAGDAILTSVLEDFRYFFYNVTLAVINRTSIAPHTVLWRSTEMVVGDVSPRARSDIDDLAERVRDYISTNPVLCQAFSDQDGVRHTGCIDNTQLQNYTFLDQRVHEMSGWQSSLKCPAGTYAEHDTLTFELQCHTCPPNTFSSTAGSTRCTACHEGLQSDAGSSACSTKSEEGFSRLLIIPIVIGAVLIIGVAALIAFALLRSTTEPTRDAANAPRGPRVAFAMIGVDGSRSDRQWRSSLATMCDVYDRLAAVVTPIANKHRVYTFVSVGDVVMLAASSTQTLFDVLVEVHHSAWSVAWPCTVYLKLVLHEGCPTVVEGRRGASAASKRVVYSGRDLDLLRSLWRHDTTHDLVLSESAMQCVTVPPEYRVLPAESYISPDLPLASMFTGVMVGGTGFNPNSNESNRVPIMASKTAAGGGGGAHKEVISNPLDLRMHNNDDGEEELRQANGSMNSNSTSVTGSEMSEAADDDLARLVAPTNISKDELDALCSLGVDVLQKFLRVFSFDDQVNIVSGIAKRLHVQAPRIPAMKTSVKRSFNVLRNSLKQICNQLLLSMDGRELQSWLRAVAQYMDQRTAIDAHKD